MVDGIGNELKKGRFPTTPEDLEDFASDFPAESKVAVEASTYGIFMYEHNMIATLSIFEVWLEFKTLSGNLNKLIECLPYQFKRNSIK